MKKLVVFVCLLISSNVFANCYTNARGVQECNNGTSAGAYNPNTGNAATAHTNTNGVTTTRTSRGGEAKTMNGKGVAEGPNGKDCYKTANSHGCN
jgi:hypothetical protein